MSQFNFNFQAQLIQIQFLNLLQKSDSGEQPQVQNPWHQDRILIETSNKDIEMCFNEILAALKEKT